MKRYLVKQVSVATEQNPNFAGQVSVSFYGKGDEIIGHTGTHAEAVHDYAEPNHYSIWKRALSYKPEIDLLHDLFRDMRTRTRKMK